MASYHWSPDYIVHDFRYSNSFVCYEDWSKMLEMLEHELLMEEYHKWELAAFIGYQGYVCTPDKAKPTMAFSKWKQSMGVKEPVTPLTAKGKSGKHQLGSKAAEIAKAKANLERMGLGGLLSGSI